MRILLVDDNSRKAGAVQAACQQLMPAGSVVVAVCGTLTDAGVLLEKESFDLLILDVQVPVREGEEPRVDGGVRFLRTMYETRRMCLPHYIVGLTEYDDSQADFQGEFASKNWHLLKYSEAADDWKFRLASLLFHIADAGVKKGDASRVDLAIVTALEDTELQAVLQLPGSWQAKHVDGDPTIYRLGNFAEEGRSLSVVAAAAIDMGMAATTAVAMKVIQRYRPRVIAMVGIAGGVKGNVGDILIADVTFDYGSGKVKQDKGGPGMFLPDPRPLPLDPLLKSKLSFFKNQRGVLEQIRAGAVGREVPKSLSVHMGPVASGAAVIEDGSVVQNIQASWRKLVGVEMETYGLFVAASLCDEPKPLAMSMKSICDFANAKKNDEYQHYAAYTSARYLYHFAIEMLGQKAN